MGQRSALARAGRLALVIGFLPSTAWAAATVTVSSVRGGATIDLGTLGAARQVAYEEVTVQMTATSALRYRVTHAVTSPLVNEQGTVLDAARMMMELTGGTHGTLEFRGAAPLPAGPAAVYTSDASGQADSFKVVYSLTGTEPPQAGTYTGILTYTLESSDGSSSDVKRVPIRVVVSSMSSLDLADTSPDRVVLRGRAPDLVVEPTRVTLELSSNAPGPMGLVHIADGGIVSEHGQELPLSSLEVTVSSGETVLQEGSLDRQLAAVVSEAQGVSHRRIDLSYRIVLPEQQPAGVYHGGVRIALADAAAADDAGGLSFHLPVEVDVPQILTLSVRSPTGGAPSLSFSRLVPGKSSPPQQLIVQVRTNLGEPYEVSQEFPHPLTSDDGRELSPEAVSCLVRSTGFGRQAIVQDMPVQAGRHAVFRSDEVGTPAEFSVDYQVRIPSAAAAGTYQSSVLFTVSTF